MVKINYNYLGVIIDIDTINKIIIVKSNNCSDFIVDSVIKSCWNDININKNGFMIKKL